MNDDLSALYNDFAFELCDLKDQVKKLREDVNSLRRANFDTQRDVDILHDGLSYVKKQLNEATK